ncbi:DUF1963 domain-containing protein [Desulfonema ishimotonii]|uniref:DUF1963 domain-containing protein n=1 Tax=Desulfonema ishimotonii TaxID=45657 RepID=A0A401FX03_9BACT|nr:YwqG family protein [Desulfonema ishimotonii]GBC61500.1 DUF1963 domain-containing protein [Desulfonema ishimotonii]
MLSADIIKEKLTKHGLKPFADKIITRMKPCLRISCKPVAGKLPVGTSKIGGQPDLPEAFPWPEWRNRPLSFLAQFNLGEIAAFPSAEVLPGEGLLLFFYDAEQSTWGFDPEDIGSWQVLHIRETSLSPRPFPDDLTEYARYRECVSAFTEQISLPEAYFSLSEQLCLSDRQMRNYAACLEELMGEDAAGHRLLGYPDTIQGDMQLACQLVSNGLFCGDPSGFNDPRARVLKAGMWDWQLLFQLTSDDPARMMWGDSGKVYFWIRQQDLARADFKKCWMMLQCC